MRTEVMAMFRKIEEQADDLARLHGYLVGTDPGEYFDGEAQESGSFERQG